MRIIKYHKRVRHIVCLTLLFNVLDSYSQGRNSIYFLGDQAKARMSFTDTSYNILTETRTIPFMDTQANISDESGNILMSSNGIFIADATGDTMSNGSGLNPSQIVDDWKDFGLPLSYADIILPMPDDSTKNVLFHQTFDLNSGNSPQVFYTIADFSFNNLGIVLSKNNIAANGLFSVGLAACKHANGRDWWIVCLSKLATEIHIFLLTPGSISYMGSQSFPVTSFPYGFAGQPTFSPDGEKFAFAGSYGITGMNYLSCVSLFNFDRCSGTFSLDTVIDFSDNYISFATAFSPNSKYLYFASTEHIYQYDTDSFGLIPYQLVATNDTFLSAPPVFYTSFYLMYLAANGKIYISSGSSVKHLHEMNYPDSAGIACDVQLHNVFTNCFFIGVPNHPNYYLGRLVGSPCDTLTGIYDLAAHDFRFSISPNPNNGNFRIMYLLPQNKSGTLQIFDITGKEIYHQNVPPWSTLQYISLPKIADGVYQCTIISNNQRVNKKLVVVE
ncbi:MAG: hypothetical protein FNNCIFGK_01907 [Bacteroidia bacterium]|nr:hypothetical protein [Bacteroidia bacterium]